MKKVIGIIIFIMLIIGNSTYATNVVAIGDSITYGYAVEEKEKYVNLVVQELNKNSEVNCENLAINGLTTEGLVTELQKEEIQKKIANADYILMSIGGNDFLNVLINNRLIILSKNVSLKDIISTMQTNLENICKILTTKSNAEIIVVPLYNPYYVALQSNTSLITEYEKAKNVFNETLTKYNKVHIIDASKELEKTENLTEELYDPHPSKNGHKLIADMEVKVIKEIELQKENQQNIQQKDNKYLVFVVLFILAILIILIIYIRGRHF